MSILGKMLNKQAILVVDGLLFHSVWDNKAEAETVIQNFAKYGKTIVMRNYGVNIQTINPETLETITWAKCKGYSLWEPATF